MMVESVLAFLADHTAPVLRLFRNVKRMESASAVSLLPRGIRNEMGEFIGQAGLWTFVFAFGLMVLLLWLATRRIE